MHVCVSMCVCVCLCVCVCVLCVCCVCVCVCVCVCFVCVFVFCVFVCMCVEGWQANPGHFRTCTFRDSLTLFDSFWLAVLSGRSWFPVYLYELFVQEALLWAQWWAAPCCGSTISLCSWREGRQSWRDNGRACSSLQDISCISCFDACSMFNAYIFLNLHLCVCVCVCVCACVFIVVLCMDFNGDKSCILWRTLVSTNSAREREQHNIYQCIYALMVMMYAQ